MSLPPGAGPSLLGFILENIGGGEILVVLLVALVVLGPDRLPEMARSAGRGLNNLRKLTSELTGDMKEVIDDPAMAPIRELGEFAVRPRQKLAQYALEAEAEERAQKASESRDSALAAEAGDTTGGETGGVDTADGDTADGDTTDGDTTGGDTTGGGTAGAAVPTVTAGMDLATFSLAAEAEARRAASGDGEGTSGRGGSAA